MILCKIFVLLIYFCVFIYVCMSMKHLIVNHLKWIGQGLSVTAFLQNKTYFVFVLFGFVFLFVVHFF